MVVTTATERIVTVGGRTLRGRVAIGGAKNAALPAMAAALLTEEECVLENVPLLDDVFVMAELLRALGAEVDLDTERHRVRIRAAEIDVFEPPPELVARMRASFLVTGPLLARFGRARSVPPGGANWVRDRSTSISAVSANWVPRSRLESEHSSFVPDGYEAVRSTWTIQATPARKIF